MREVGAVMVLLGLCLIFGGVYVYKGETIVERPYLVENEGLPQFHFVADTFTWDAESENYVYQGSFGISWIQQENTASAMFITGEDILIQENNVWHWNLETALTVSIVGDMKSVELNTVGSKIINIVELENVIISDLEGTYKGSFEFVYPAYDFGVPLSILENFELGIYMTLQNAENYEFALAFDPSTKRVRIFENIIEDLTILDIDYLVVKDVGQRKLVNFDVLAVKENVGKLIGHGIIVTPNLYRFEVEKRVSEYWWIMIAMGVMFMIFGFVAMARPSRIYGR